MKMRVKKAIGEYNYNLGSGPNHSMRQADPIPVGTIVDVRRDGMWTHVTWHADVDSYGNQKVHASLLYGVEDYLEAAGPAETEAKMERKAYEN